MISIEEALERILSHVDVLEHEEKPILDCLGQVIAEDVYSDIDIPPLDNAAMDGYAVQWGSIQGATPSSHLILSVIGEVAAGSITEREVKPGTAIRIMTGAPVPQGADTVLPFEETDEVARREALSPGVRLSEIGILQEAEKGANIRSAGEDISRGALIISRGTVLNPPEIGVLASLGQSTARVIRRPVVTVLATGNELVEVERSLPVGKIYDSNTFSIAAQILHCGGIPNILGIARDTPESLAAKIRQGLDSDMFITSAGVSVGDYDMVKDVLAEHGKIDFWTVRMKPGKPLAFGILNGDGKKVPHLGLPGNPVSSMVAFEQFGRPAILKMLGKKNQSHPTIYATIQGRIQNREGRRVFARAAVTKIHGEYFAKLTGSQGSGVLTSMIRANGLVVVPEDVSLVREGDLVQVQMLDWSEGV